MKLTLLTVLLWESPMLDQALRGSLALSGATGATASRSPEPATQSSGPQMVRMATAFAQNAPSGAPSGAPNSAQEPNKDPGQQPAAGRQAPAAGLEREALLKKQDELNRREQALNQLEAELDAKLQRLQKLEQKLSVMLEDAGEIKDKKLKHLVDVYSNMKAKQAAAVLETLDESIAVKILAGMRGRQAGEILTYVKAKKAASLSEKLTKMQIPFDK